MKVILLQDVKSLGKKGAMVEVNEGYARNFIIPKKLGMEATPKNMNDFKLDANVYDDMIRISVGIEDVEDLIEDFQKALES